MRPEKLRRGNLKTIFYLTSFYMKKNDDYCLEDFVAFGRGKSFMDTAVSSLSGQKVLFVSDEKIWKNCADFFPKNFAKKVENFLLLKNPKADEKNLKKISTALKNCEVILCLGSGTLNDLCKFTAAQKNINYAIFPSAASMNGYLSRNASITISGHKKTLAATLPKVVFCNLEILAKAPAELTKSGIGDVSCFYSCWFDWYLSHKILGTKFDEKPFLVLQKKMQFLLKNFAKFSLKDEKFLEILLEIILLSGLGMTRCGGSYPASQSEHMIAHTFEMKYPKIAAKNLHGNVIAATVLTSNKLQQKILQMPDFPELVADVDAKKITKFFGKKIVAACLEEYQEKITLQQLVTRQGWGKIKKELEKIYVDSAALKAVFAHFKIATSVKSLGLSDQQYQDCVAHAKFTRNRFTCLDFS